MTALLTVRHRLILALVAVVCAPALAVAQAPPSAADLAARIQAHYATVRDFTADFTLEQTSTLRPTAKRLRGHVEIKKPLRMRWTYTEGDRNEFVSDGTNLYSYFPEDGYVDVTPLPDENAGSVWLLFLAGRGDLTRDFVSSLAPEQPAGEWRLILEPKPGRTADFQRMTLEVKRSTLELTGLFVVDDQGGTSRYRFEHLRENRGLADRQFVFEMPKGVEVNWHR